MPAEQPTVTAGQLVGPKGDGTGVGWTRDCSQPLL